MMCSEPSRTRRVAPSEPEQRSRFASEARRGGSVEHHTQAPGRRQKSPPSRRTHGGALASRSLSYLVGGAGFEPATLCL